LRPRGDLSLHGGCGEERMEIEMTTRRELAVIELKHMTSIFHFLVTRAL
jgi:hypothetical protein